MITSTTTRTTITMTIRTTTTTMITIPTTTTKTNGDDVKTTIEAGRKNRRLSTSLAYLAMSAPRQFNQRLYF